MIGFLDLAAVIFQLSPALQLAFLYGSSPCNSRGKRIHILSNV